MSILASHSWGQVESTKVSLSRSWVRTTLSWRPFILLSDGDDVFPLCDICHIMVFSENVIIFLSDASTTRFHLNLGILFLVANTTNQPQRTRNFVGTARVAVQPGPLYKAAATIPSLTQKPWVFWTRCVFSQSSTGLTGTIRTKCFFYVNSFDMRFSGISWNLTWKSFTYTYTIRYVCKYMCVWVSIMISNIIHKNPIGKHH